MLGGCLRETRVGLAVVPHEADVVLIVSIFVPSIGRLDFCYDKIPSSQTILTSLIV